MKPPPINPMNSTPPGDFLNRRNFLKIASAATLGFLAFLSMRTMGSSSVCRGCGIALGEVPQLLSRRGKCRNCGADPASGEKIAAKIKISAESPKQRGGFGAAQVPFPHPEIRHLTEKPCASLAELHSGQSRVRKPFNLAHR